ncbi:hypothetical protein CPB83DRAFT_399832 [Crepidotus variabilis]|uniref:SWIM-type domain-containing protein n=1 Tax=Crepidotus variabilis TaxID=179855 RepID=A0A9P6EDW0_9AGAR|nr:hypothetical protein CPB83DRAFT_399832 [Crepidotus variabilis]
MSASLINAEMLSLANMVINSIEPGPSGYGDTLTRLGAIFPQDTVVSAFDLLDRHNVIYHNTPWGHKEYQVIGQTATYAVFLDLIFGPIPFSCSCPAFTNYVLRDETHIMCKHILATLLGRKLGLCTEQASTTDDLARLYCQQYPPELQPDPNAMQM